MKEFKNIKEELVNHSNWFKKIGDKHKCIQSLADSLFEEMKRKLDKK